MIYFKAASVVLPLLNSYAIRAADAIDAISKNTNKLNKSPVSSNPSIPTTISKNNV